MDKRILHLNLKGVYWDQIKAGEKSFEYRLTNDFWKKSLVGKVYDEIHIKRGYPKKGDTSRILIKPWIGFEIRELLHEHFGSETVQVFAIKVNG